MVAERLTGTSHSHGSMVHRRRRGGKGGRRRRRGKGGREARCRTGGEVTGAGPASTRRTAATDRGRGVEAPDTRRERRAISDSAVSAARRLEIWNVKLGLGLGAARSGACLLYQEGEPGRGLVGPANGLWGHRAATGPPLWTGPCPCRATGQGGGPSPSWSLGPGRPGPGGHRAVPFSGRAKTPGRGPGREPAGCMAIYICA